MVESSQVVDLNGVEENLVYRVAYLSYVKRLSIKEIGEDLNRKGIGCSRNKISSLLREAMASGIVSIEVKAPRDYRMGEEILEKFTPHHPYLMDVIVISPPGGEDDTISVLESLAEGACKVINRFLKDGYSIGVSGGRTLKVLGQRFSPERVVRDISICALSGGIGVESAAFTCNTVCGELAGQFGTDEKGIERAKGFALYVPSFMTEEERKALLEKPDVARAYEKALTVDMAVIGIGGFEPTKSARKMTDLRLAVQELGLDVHEWPKEAVGDIAYQLFGSSGEPIAFSWEEMNQVIAVPLTKFREITEAPARHVIAVAGGWDKKEAVLGALLGRYFDILVIDTSVAKYLLNEDIEKKLQKIKK